MVTTLATVWDSADEAKEFEAALTERAPKRRVRRGDVVALLAATPDVPEKTQAGVLEAVLAAAGSTP